MKIASITLFCNERFRLQPWMEYFGEYKEDIYIQVIVNNGNPKDTDLLKKTFPNAVVLCSETQNMISSYNFAIKYIMDKTDADSILQITNDLLLERGGLKVLYNILFEKKEYGLISPILLKKNTEIIENYGAEINFGNMDFKHIDRNVNYSDIVHGIVFRTGLPGGCFLTKKEVYEKIGLQDERINMYSDEVDMGIKCAKVGYKLLSTSRVRSWHQHIFPVGRKQRSQQASFFMARNPIYIAKKYYGFRVVASTFFRRLKYSFIEISSCIHHLKDKEAFLCAWSSFKGCVAGLFY